MTIRDGRNETSPIEGKFCGAEIPPSLTTTGNQMRIHFHSDESTAEEGFSAIVSAYEPDGEPNAKVDFHFHLT